MPIDLSNAFRGFSLPAIDQARRQNALGQLDLQQQTQKVQGMMNPNATPEQLARSGNVDVANAVTQQQQIRQQNAARVVSTRLLTVRGVADMKRLVADPNFGAAAEAVGMPHPSEVDNFEGVTDEQVRQQAANLARALGVSVTGSQIQSTFTGGNGNKWLVYQDGRAVDTGIKEHIPDRAPQGYYTGEGGRLIPAPGGPADPNKPPPIPSGYQRTPEGLAPTKGGPADPAAQNKPLTERDKQNTVLFNSLVNSEADIQKLKDQPGAENTASLSQQLLGTTPVTRVMQSDMYRRYESAGLRWAANLLYLKSGATATPAEIQSTWRQFFPQPGDGEGAIAQKEQSRQQEIESIRSAMVPNAKPLQQAAPTDDQPPAGVPPELWKVMPPQDRALWR